MEIVNSYQVPTSKNVAMIHELEDLGALGTHIENFPDLIHVFGDADVIDLG